MRAQAMEPELERLLESQRVELAQMREHAAIDSAQVQHRQLNTLLINLICTLSRNKISVLCPCWH